MGVSEQYTEIKTILDGISSPFTINNTFKGRQFWVEDNIITANVTTTINSKNFIEWWEIFTTAQSNRQGTTTANFHLATMSIQGFFSYTQDPDAGGSGISTEVIFNQKIESIIKALGSSGNFLLSNNIDIRDLADTVTVGHAPIGSKFLHNCIITISGMETEFAE